MAKKASKSEGADKTQTRKRSRKKADPVANVFTSQPTTLNELESRAELFQRTMQEHYAATKRVTAYRSLAGHKEELCGVPLPALSLRYFFGNNVYVLGRTLMLAGFEGTCKTAFAVEVGRWHLMAGGIGKYAQNEAKDSPDIRKGLFQAYSPTLLRRFDSIRTECIEEWQSMVTFEIRAYQEMVKKHAVQTPPPFWLCVDSLMGTTTRQKIDSIWEEGHAQADFAREASLISTYFKALPTFLGRWPISLVITNHEKPPMATVGSARGGAEQQNRVSGGKAPQFAETFEIRMRRAGDIATTQYNGVRIVFKLHKNSAGESRKSSITADLIWWWQPNPETGEQEQLFLWDWNKATTETLVRLSSSENDKWAKATRDALRDACGIRAVSGGRYYSPVLGIPESDAQDPRTVGAALEANPKAMADVSYLLRIAERPVYGPDYRFLDTLHAEPSSGAEDWAQAAEQAEPV